MNDTVLPLKGQPVGSNPAVRTIFPFSPVVKNLCKLQNNSGFALGRFVIFSTRSANLRIQLGRSADEVMESH
jgi:hypothetical protein